MTEVKVSVIIPVFNVEKYIDKCLYSLINQTLKEIEIILINDKSTDSSGEICDRYASLDDRIIVIHNQKNLKQGLCRNKGIEVAKGDYLSFIDPDDWVDLDFIEKLYFRAKEGEFDIVKAQTIKVFSNGKQEIQTKQNRFIKKGMRKKTPLYILFTYEHFSAIYKRKIISENDIRYPDIRNAEDNVFLLRFTYFSKKMKVILNTNYYYRQHDQSTISRKNKAYFESILKYFQLYIEFINDHDIEKANYNLVFARGFYSITAGYQLLETLDIGYKDDYINNVFEILKLYKYEQSYLLDNLLFGLNYSNKSNNLRNNKLFRFAHLVLVNLSKQ